MLSFSLRSLSAASKFFLVSYLGVTLTPDSLGQFALFATIVVLFTQVAGLEINQTLGRRIHGITRQARVEYFSQHVVLASLSYVLLSLILVYSYYGSFDGLWHLALPILYLEHITTELYRYRIQLLMPIRASLCIFLKNAWILISVPLHEIALFPEFTISNIFVCWLVSLILSLVVGMPIVRRAEVAYFIRKKILLLGRSIALLRQSSLLILSAFFVTVTSVFDKLYIERILDLPSLGEYFLYQTISSMPAILVSFTLMVTAWPQCVRLSALGQIRLYMEARSALGKSMIRILLVTSSVVFIVALFASKYFENLSINLLLLSALLASSAFFSLCDVQKLDLYTSHDDLALVFGNFLHAVIVLIAILSAGYFWGGHEAIAVGAMGGNLVSLILYWLRLPKKIERLMRR